MLLSKELSEGSFIVDGEDDSLEGDRAVENEEVSVKLRRNPLNQELSICFESPPGIASFNESNNQLE